jgi:arylsulfatase A-like enzyme
MSTVCEIAGVASPISHVLDGESILDVLIEQPRARKRPLFWEWRFRIAGEPFHHSPELAVRDGDWKLYLNPDGSRVELYDMKKDLTQLNNVSEHHPEIVERMRQSVLAWAKTLPDGPRDPGAGQMKFTIPK